MIYRVVYRVWSNGDVVALFPDIPFKAYSTLVTCYQHIGQHSAADYPLVIRQTRPATPEEYADLAEELKGRGYDLEPVKRAQVRFAWSA